MSKCWFLWLVVLIHTDAFTAGCKAQPPARINPASTPPEHADKEHLAATGWSGTTSFEELSVGAFEKLNTNVGIWTPASGKTIVDVKHAKSGTNCLQLTGGEKTAVVLEVKEPLSDEGNLTFWAERWTSRKPFAFRVHSKTEKGWSLLYDGSDQIRVGRAFLSRVKVPLNDSNITHLRFEVQSPPGTGILIDDVRIAPTQPQRIKSAEVIPWVLPALVGTEASALLKIRIDTIGTRNPISLKTINASVCGHLGTIESVGMYATQGNPRFETKTLFGQRTPVARRKVQLGRHAASALHLNTSNTEILINAKVTGSHELSEGENYFWVSCCLSDDADIDSLVGASCQSLVFSNDETRTLAGEFHYQKLGVALRMRGDDSVHTYRIPGLVTTPRGTLIAVYDVRRGSGGDLPGDIDVGMSRSSDGGRTWEDMKVIMDMGKDPKWNYDGIGDPAALVDQRTGTIWVAGTWSHGNRSWRGSGQGLTPDETGQLMLVKSTDDGRTWSQPINITKQIKNPDWCFVLQGPGKGITMQDGTLVFAAQYQDSPHKRRLPHSTIIHSSDHGATWSIGTAAYDDTTEAQVIELEPGVLMLNCRYNRTGLRVVMTSRDMGTTWKKHSTSQSALIEPGACMASLIDPSAEVGSSDTKLLLFSNPNSKSGRDHITIKASLDRGLTWPQKYSLLLDEQPSAGYSCMAMIDQQTVGILYEGSQANMTFQRIPLVELTGAQHLTNTKDKR